MSMQSILHVVREHEDELRAAFTAHNSRTGLFRNSEGTIVVRNNVPLGGRYSEEVIQIFADEHDLDFFLKIYGGQNQPGS